MSRILIVDDDAVSRALIKEVLSAKGDGWEFSFAASGAEAFGLLKKEPADVVLLDVIMPGEDGFDVLRRLKADPALKNLPVLLITAIDDTDKKVEGFRLGAADYIVKPVNGDEARARVDAHLRIKRGQDELRAAHEDLLRTQSALVESSKMAAVGSLASGVAHEFNNILFIMSGYLQTYGKSSDVKALRVTGGVFAELIERASAIVRSLLDFARNDDSPSPADLREILQRDISLLEKRFSETGVSVVRELEAVPKISCYPGQLSQVFVNLMLNASEAMAGRASRRLTVGLRVCRASGDRCTADPSRGCRPGGCLLAVFADTGGGIPAAARANLFSPFVTTKGAAGGGNANAPGKGLGLFVSYGIVSRHGGSILVDSAQNEGSVFTVALPLNLSQS